MDTLKLLNEHHKLHLKLEELEHELEQMQVSRSWKVTRPLRNIRGLLNGLVSYLKFTPYRLKAIKRSCVSEYASFEIQPLGPFLPAGRSKWYFDHSVDKFKTMTLYIDAGEGFTEQLCLKGEPGNIVQEFCLPRFVRSMRLDFSGINQTVDSEFSVKVVLQSSLLLFARCLFQRLFVEKKSEELFKILLQMDFLLMKKFVFGGYFPVFKEQKLYQKWIEKSERKEIADFLASKKQAKPLYSIVLPVYNTSERWLRAAIESVLKQSYAGFEVCIADDASTRPDVKRILEEYKSRDQRIKVSYRSENGHISKCSNTALSMAKGDYVVLLDHDDLLAPDALQIINCFIEQYPQAACFYSDEDRITSNGIRRDVYRKKEFSLAVLLNQNVISHLGCFKREVLEKIDGFREGYEGSQDWDLALRFLAKVTPNGIKHIPFVLYHWRDVPGTVSFSPDSQHQAFDAGATAVSSFIEMNNWQASVKTENGIIKIRSKNAADFAIYAPGINKKEQFAGITSLTTLSASEVQQKYIIFLDSTIRSVLEIDLLQLQFYLENNLCEVIGGRILETSGRIHGDGLDDRGSLINHEQYPHSLLQQAGHCSISKIATPSSLCFVVESEFLKKNFDLNLLEKDADLLSGFLSQVTPNEVLCASNALVVQL